MKGNIRMKGYLLNVGYGNVVVVSRIIAIVTPNSAPLKRLREDAKSSGKLIDATTGKKNRSIIVTDSGHVILSAVQVKTMAQRFDEDFNFEEGKDKKWKEAEK